MNVTAFSHTFKTCDDYLVTPRNVKENLFHFLQLGIEQTSSKWQPWSHP